MLPANHVLRSRRRGGDLAPQRGPNNALLGPNAVLLPEVRHVVRPDAADHIELSDEVPFEPPRDLEYWPPRHKADAVMVVGKEIMHKQNAAHLPAACHPKQLRGDGHAGRETDQHIKGQPTERALHFAPGEPRGKGPLTDFLHEAAKSGDCPRRDDERLDTIFGTHPTRGGCKRRIPVGYNHLDAMASSDESAGKLVGHVAVVRIERILGTEHEHAHHAASEAC